MRILLCLLFLQFSLSTFSQPYSCFHKSRPAYYNFNYNYITFYQQAAIAIDSFEVNGNDTSFFHSNIIDYDNSISYCYLKAHDTSFVGAQSIRTVNGDDEFFNRHGDTIFFINNSSVNDNWTMLNLGGGNKIIATVQDISLESILGVNDSVKTITLQAKDNLGNNIANIFNNKIFKIGESTGFVSGYSLFHFPEDTIGFSIVGIENPPLGLNTSELSPEKIFDFEVGDRFDYEGGWNTEPTMHYHYYRINKLISKNISVDGDTLAYTFHTFNFEESNDWGNYYSGFNVDTSTIIYVLSQYDFMEVLPYQWSGFGDYEGGPSWLIPSVYSAGSTVMNFFDNYFNWDDTCLNEVIWGVGPGNIQYARGLGKTYRYYGGTGWDNYDYLIYFNKNGIEWGDSINWAEITGVNEISKENSLKVFPNPSNDFVLLEGNFPSPQIEIHLLNLFGEEVKQINVNTTSQRMKLDISDLTNGLYLLRIQSGEKVFTQKVAKN